MRMNQVPRYLLRPSLCSSLAGRFRLCVLAAPECCCFPVLTLNVVLVSFAAFLDGQDCGASNLECFLGLSAMPQLLLHCVDKGCLVEEICEAYIRKIFGRSFEGKGTGKCSSIWRSSVTVSAIYGSVGMRV